MKTNTKNIMHNNKFKFLKKILFLIILFPLLSNCARDLSSNVYTSDSTQSFTLEGKVISTRQIVIKESDKLSDNTTGTLAGGAMGAAIGSTAGRGGNSAGAIGMVGGAIIGGTVGALAQGGLGKSKGYEYVIKIDRSKIKRDQYYDGSVAMRNAISSALSSGLMTIVQGTDTVFRKGQKVYVIVSNKRTRIISAS